MLEMLQDESSTSCDKMMSILQSLPKYLKENESLRKQKADLAEFAEEEEVMKRGDPGKTDYIAHVIGHIIIKIDELEML